MRFLFPAIAVISFVSCSPVSPNRPAAEQQKVSRAEVVAAAPTPPSAPANDTRLTSTNIVGITFEGVAFDSRKNRLVVADQANGPGSQFSDAASAARARGGIAAVNAGFFTPEGAPLGMVISAGKIAGSWNSASSLGSGVWFGGSGKTGIVRREKLGRAGAVSLRELIQAGPMLVENGHSISGLDPVKTSARTFILWDGGTRWWIGRSSPCSLDALGNALGTAGPGGWKVRQGLNLDGGRSADLWVSNSISGGPLTRRAPWNRPVRNFLVLVPQ